MASVGSWGLLKGELGGSGRGQGLGKEMHGGVGGVKRATEAGGLLPLVTVAAACQPTRGWGSQLGQGAAQRAQENQPCTKEMLSGPGSPEVSKDQGQHCQWALGPGIQELSTHRAPDVPSPFGHVSLMSPARGLEMLTNAGPVGAQIQPAGSHWEAYRKPCTVGKLGLEDGH